MARTLSFQQLTIPANTSVSQQTDVNNSEFNPLAQTSRVTLFGAATTAGVAGKGGMLTLKLGTDVQCTDFILPIAAAVSTRDHQVATGVAARGTKITVGYRNEGTATPTINAYLVIEPI